MADGDCVVVYAALEFRVRKVMKEKGLKLTGAERRVNVRPTGEFLLKYVSYLGIALIRNQTTGKWTVANMTEEFTRLLSALEHEWMKYYLNGHYKFMSDQAEV